MASRNPPASSRSNSPFSGKMRIRSRVRDPIGELLRESFQYDGQQDSRHREFEELLEKLD